MEIVRKCEVCESASTIKCPECLVTYYCSDLHRSEHWGVHEPQCSARNVEKIIGEEDPAISHYVAKRDILKGQTLFMDEPLIVFPYIDELRRQSLRHLKQQPHICLGCCRPVGSRRLCSKCKWPVCNTACEREIFHSQMECPILAKNSVAYNDAYMRMYVWIAVLRTLRLRDISPTRWNDLCNLPVYTAKKRAEHETIVNNQRVMSFIRKRCKISTGDFDEETTTKILEIIYTNVQVQGTCGRLDKNSFHIPRSCISNVGVVGMSTDNPTNLLEVKGKFKYFASENINKGEKLIIYHNFKSERFVMGTDDRQSILRGNEQPICKCELCCDPSEAQSFISAISCECSGSGPNKDYPNQSYNVILPVNPLDCSSEWKCNACQKIKTSDAISDIVASAEDESEEFIDEFVHSIELNIDAVLTANRRMDTLALHRILRSYNGHLHRSETVDHEETTVVHPSHSIVCEEKLILIRAHYAFLVVNQHPVYSPTKVSWKGRYIEIPPRTPFDGLSRYYRRVCERLQEMSEYLLRIVEKFSASVSAPRVILNYMLAFSKWMIIIDNVKENQNYDDFLQYIAEWCVLKDKADLLLVLDEGEYPGKQRWCGCADWLRMMNSVNVVKDPSINSRDLYDSLLNIPWVRIEDNGV